MVAGMTELSNSDLESVLEETQRVIADAVARAKQELVELDARRAHLEQLIARAEAGQVAKPLSTSSGKPLTLHEAIVVVLKEGGGTLTVREIADVVNARSLYRKKDGSPVEANQIHARTKNYTAYFDKDGPRVSLRDSAPKVAS